MKRYFDTYLFAVAPPERLALLRIALGLFVLFYVGSRFGMYTKLASSGKSMFEPVGVAAFLSGPLSPEVFQAILGITLSLNVAFIAGIFHRFVGPVFGLLLLFVLCYRNSWSMIFHCDNVLVFHALILGLAPAATAWSWDAWRKPPDRSQLEPQWRYGWALQLMCAVTALTYFLAGVAKLAGPLGISWVTGESLRAQILVDALRKEVLGSAAGNLAYALHNQLFVFTLIGVSSLIIELGAPIALAHRRLSQLWAFGAFGMHWGIYFVMGILFRYQLSGFIFLPFFPLERLVYLFLRSRTMGYQANDPEPRQVMTDEPSAVHYR